MRYRFLRFPNCKTKAVTLSYDDGPTADVQLLKTIDKYGIKCTFNLNNDELRKGSGISEEQVRELILKKDMKWRYMGLTTEPKVLYVRLKE